MVRMLSLLSILVKWIVRDSTKSKNSVRHGWGVDCIAKIRRNLVRGIHYPNGVKKFEKIDKDGIKHKYIIVKPKMLCSIQLHVAESGQENRKLCYSIKGFLRFGIFDATKCLMYSEQV